MMRHVMMAALMCAAMAMPLSAVQADDISSPKLRIEWADFKTLHAADEAIVVDVRSVEAYTSGHIPGALSIPLDEIEKRVGELKKLARPIVLYCA